MKRDASPLRKGKRVYSGTDIPVDVRTAIARFTSSWQEQGGTVQGYVDAWNRAGYPIKMSSLKRWRADLESSGSAFSDDKGSGRPHALADEQVRILLGWVLHQNDAGVAVHLYLSRGPRSDRAPRLGLLAIECETRI